MCLIVLAYKVHPDYPLIVVANRDESYGRPSQAARWWPNGKIFAGRDLQAGGTWMGFNREGCWAAVTNFREGRPDPAPRSRGDLVADFLAGNTSASTFCNEVQSRGDAYNGFNLVAGDADTLACCSNRQPDTQLLEPGIHTLSNHLLNIPWPKAVAARNNLATALQESFTPQSLLNVLSNRKTFAEDQLPETGLDLAIEKALSAAFIVTESYGTRCTTVLMIDRQKNIHFLEQSFLKGEPAESVETCFRGF